MAASYANSFVDPTDVRTSLEWRAHLDINHIPERNYRRTSIIGTIGMLSFAALAGLLGLLRWTDLRERLEAEQNKMLINDDFRTKDEFG
jgi:hypothetical protein